MDICDIYRYRFRIWRNSVFHPKKVIWYWSQTILVISKHCQQRTTECWGRIVLSSLCDLTERLPTFRQFISYTRNYFCCDAWCHMSHLACHNCILFKLNTFCSLGWKMDRSLIVWTRLPGLNKISRSVLSQTMHKPWSKQFAVRDTFNFKNNTNSFSILIYFMNISHIIYPKLA